METEWHSVLLDYWNGFYHSGFFLFLKIILAIYSAVLLADIIILLMLRGVSANIREKIMGMDIPAVKPSAMIKRWEKIKERLNSNNPSQYKVAILEADSATDEIIVGIGYKGADMGERLDKIKSSQFEKIEELKAAHIFRNKIIYEVDLSVSREEAERMILVYEDFLKKFQYL